MHLLITADTIGGVWTYTRELVCGLLDRGHKVTLVSFGKIPGPTESDWLARKNLTYYPTVFPLEWMQDAQPGITESARYLARVVYENRPDVLHFSQFCYGALELGLPKVIVAHSDVLTWWKAVHESDAPETGWIAWYKSLVSRGLHCADAVVTPSSWMMNALREYYELPQRQFVIYNGRSASLFTANNPKADCVLSVGRLWDEAKQMKLLFARQQFVPVTIAGSAKHPETNASAGYDLPQGENIKFSGEQDESHLRQLYSECATYAATSRYEPFGLAPVEAALSRCALIANDIPVFRELWGNAAFYFERNDPDSLAHAIRLLACNASLRELFADQAYERARSCFTSSRMVSEYEELYRSLHNGRGTA